MSPARVMKSTVFSAASVLVAVAVSGCDATQPRPKCRAQGSEYGASYTMQGSPMGSCTGKLLTGEILHLQYYRAAPNDPLPAASVAIEPDSVAKAMAAAMNPAGAGVEYSMGKYSTVEPDDNDICQAPLMSETSITTPMARLSYLWSNIRMLVKPTSNAIHFGADLIRKDGDCTVSYKVSAINPAHHCGDGMNAQGEHDPTTGRPDNANCDTDPEERHRPQPGLRLHLRGQHAALLALQGLPRLQVRSQVVVSW